MKKQMEHLEIMPIFDCIEHHEVEWQEHPDDADAQAHRKRHIEEINAMSDEEFTTFIEADAQAYAEYLADLQDLQATAGGR